MRIGVFVFAAGWLVTAAGAQPWGGIQNPPGLELSLRLLDPHPYQQGELIRVEMKLPNTFPGQGTPPAEIWTFGGLLLDPAQDCGLIAKPCFQQGGVIGGLMTRRDQTVLNQFLPALPPGRYRAALLATKQVRINPGAMNSSYNYADPPQYAVSGTVEFEIVAADAAWTAQAIGASVATLQSAQPTTQEGYQKREEAAQQLQFLDGPAAWRASLSLLPEQEGTLLGGLESTRQPEQVCALMQAQIPAAEQAVTNRYLWTLQQVCTKAHLPAPPMPKSQARPMSARIATTPVPAGVIPKRDPAMDDYFQKLQAYQAELWKNATGTLAASLSQKAMDAKAAAFQTLLEYFQQHRSPAPPWVPSMSREFVAWWPSADTPARRHLLDLFANTMQSPDVVPLLEAVLDRWKPGDYYEAAHSAIAELNQIDPRKARERIMAEMVKPQTWLDTPQLELLPASAVTPMDQALIGALAAAREPGGWNPGLRSAAIAKYGTAGAEARFKAIYEAQQDPCQPELAAYFVRVDPAYADRIFHSHPWDMQTPPPRCTVQYFLRTPPLAMGPPLEKYLEAYLMHGNVYVKTTAAHQLGLYGSPSALGPLWNALRYFHEWWKGKGPELEQNGEGVHLEVELRNAIAHSPNWLATETDLRTMQSLCISRQCLGETQQDLASWQQPLRIEFAGPSGGWRGRVAQYFVTSPASLEAKLAQFPAGTRFVLADQADPAAAARLREFAASRGLMLVSPK